MKQAIYKIGGRNGKQYMLSSLMGYSESRFVKEGQGSKEDYAELKPFINPDKPKKAKKSKDA